jgi:hypothetical protein
MRNILENVRKRDYDEVKVDARQSIAKNAGARQKPRSAVFIAAGTQLTRPLRIDWVMICPSSYRSSASPSTYGGNCVRQCD